MFSFGSKGKYVVSKMVQTIRVFTLDAYDMDIYVSVCLSRLPSGALSVTGSGYLCTVGKASIQKG